MKKLLLSGLAILSLATINAQILTANDAATFGTWTAADVDGDTYTWGVYDLSTSGAHVIAQGEAAVSFSWGDPAQPTAGALSPDNWLISPAMDFSGMSAVSLNFIVASLEDAGSIYAAESWAVYAATSPAGLATATALLDETIADGGTIYTKTVDLSAFVGAPVVHIGFRHYNTTDMYGLVLDDVVVSGTPNTSGINANVISTKVYPNPASDVLNIVASEEISNVSIISLDGKVVATSTTSSVNVAELISGMYVYEVITTSGSVSRNTFMKK